MEGCHEMGKSLLRNRTLTHLDLSANRVSFDAFRQLLRGVVHNKVLKVLKVRKWKFLSRSQISQCFTKLINFLKKYKSVWSKTENLSFICMHVFLFFVERVRVNKQTLIYISFVWNWKQNIDLCVLFVGKVGVNPITTDGAFAILQSIAVSDSSLEEIDLKVRNVFKMVSECTIG